MAITRLSVPEFLALANDHIALDVRSPSEYKHAHIPSAISLPLFTDEERKVIGTTYKQVSREGAIKIGLEYFGPNMRQTVDQVELLLQTRKKNNDHTVLVHCWRGGMRSGAVAWLLDLYGFKVYTLSGGYKAFRGWALEQFNIDYPFAVIGGYTGSGKTAVLHQLQNRGEAVLDLEGIAQHRGSAFGALDRAGQPSTEQFENEIALQLYQYAQARPNDIIWVEDESQRIGDVNMPYQLWQMLRAKPLYFLDIPFEDRLDYLVQEYGHFKKEALINAIVRIRKRLGGLEAKTAVNALMEDDLRTCFGELLRYYDKHYAKALANRPANNENAQYLKCGNTNAADNSKLILAQHYEQRHNANI